MVEKDLKYEVLQYRANHNLTQQQFAELLKVSVPVIIALENGRSIRKLNQVKIQAFLEENK